MTLVAFELTVAALETIARAGAPSADSAEALNKAETIPGQRPHVLVRCELAVALELREWFAVATRLTNVAGDTKAALVCAAAAQDIDAAIQATTA